MAINGIGSFGYGNYNNYQSSLNDMRLQQILTKNPKAVQAIESINGTGSSLKGSSMDFLKSYNSNMSNLMQSANALKDTNSSGVANKLEAISSDTSVATVSEHYRLRDAKSITLDVEQIAMAQKNVSTGVKGTDIATQEMDFNITGSAGSVNVKVSATNENGSSRSNREMLQDAAKQINAGKSGVTALVKEKDGATVLELQSKKTGSSNGFSISGELGAASGADVVTTAAQNAEYTVEEGGQKRSYTASTNNIQLDTGKIAATLKDTGKTTISSQVNSDKVIEAVSDLLNSYNAARNHVTDNASRGSGASRQGSNFSRDLISSKSMEMLGISTNKEGNLTLDKDVLKKALEKDPSLTKDLISGSNGIAQKAFSRASSAMSANSASLISNDLAELDMQYSNDPYNFMNLYSGAGAYNMKNYYAIGMITNFLA